MRQIFVALEGRQTPVIVETGTLGLGQKLLQDIQTDAGTAAEAAQAAQAAQDAAEQAKDEAIAATAAKLDKSANLSDVDDVEASRDNLGLGDSATLDVGTEAGTVAAGDDDRILAVADKLNKLTALSSLTTLPSSAAQVFVQCRTTPGDGYAGTFEWISGDQSANVAADTAQGVWAASAPDPTGATGAWKRIFNGGVWLDWFGAGNGDPDEDQAAWEAAVAFADATGVSPIWLEAKDYYQTDSWVLYAPGLKVKGAGAKYDWWGNAQVGTRLITSGAGNPKRWTDIDGSDPADDTPQIVYGANATSVEGVTLDTRGANPWSVGFFVAGVKQCSYSNVQAFGHTDGCFYLDGTWSNRNTTLMGLHPEVKPDTGPTEFTGIGHYFRAGGTDGFAVRVKGTTRAYDAVPINDWPWAPAGISDCRLSQGRFGSDATVGGGLFDMDVQLPGTAATYGQGVTVRDTAFRLNSGRYQARFDRANRVIFDGCYGEQTSGGGSAGEFAVTSRTKASLDGIILIGDKFNTGSVTVDGVAVTGSGVEPLYWEKTRCVSRYRADGRIFTPNFNASTSSLELSLNSFGPSGQVVLKADDGTAQTGYLVFNTAQIRPLTDLAISFGSSNNRINTSHVQTRRWAVSGVVADFCGAGSPEGAVSAAVGSTYRRTNGGAATTFYVKESGSGNTGWIAK